MVLSNKALFICIRCLAIIDLTHFLFIWAMINNVSEATFVSDAFVNELYKLLITMFVLFINT